MQARNNIQSRHDAKMCQIIFRPVYKQLYLALQSRAREGLT